MMDTLQEVLAAFDDPCKKRLDYHHVSAALSLHQRDHAGEECFVLV